jgi:hypothetical protein
METIPQGLDIDKSMRNSTNDKRKPSVGFSDNSKFSKGNYGVHTAWFSLDIGGVDV